MNNAEYLDLLQQIETLRSNWVVDKPGVPPTRPILPPTGTVRRIPLEGRTIKVFWHVPTVGDGPWPVYFNHHGGGMCIGSAEMDEFICEAVSKQANCVVINTDYRLAPEHPYPKGVSDAYETIQYVLAHAEEFKVDPKKVAFGGQSAGGSIAGYCCIKANRTKDFYFDGIVMVYAGMNYTPPKPERVTIPGVAPKTTGLLYSKCYTLDNADPTNPLVSPVFATADDIRDTTSALIMPAELDALRVDSEAFAQTLMHAGVPVLYRQFQNCVHGFTHRAYEKEPGQAIDMIADYLRFIWKV